MALCPHEVAGAEACLGVCWEQGSLSRGGLPFRARGPSLQLGCATLRPWPTIPCSSCRNRAWGRTVSCWMTLALRFPQAQQGRLSGRASD